MKPVLIVFATREGHTHNIAGRIAESLGARDFPSDVVETNDIGPAGGFGDYSGVVAIASVRTGRHEPALVGFVKTHRETLAELPSAFLSVDLADPHADVPISTAIDRAKAGGHVPAQVDRLFTETGWNPSLGRPVAGVLMLSRHGWLVTWTTRRKGRTSIGHARAGSYTDWEKLDEFVEQFVSKELQPTFKFRTM